MFTGEEPETISLSQAFISHARDSQLVPDFNRDTRHPPAKSEKNERHFGFEWRSSWGPVDETAQETIPREKVDGRSPL